MGRLCHPETFQPPGTGSYSWDPDRNVNQSFFYDPTQRHGYPSKKRSDRSKRKKLVSVMRCTHLSEIKGTSIGYGWQSMSQQGRLSVCISVPGTGTAHRVCGTQPLRLIFALRKWQKNASLNFCTPDRILCFRWQV